MFNYNSKYYIAVVYRGTQHNNFTLFTC